MPRSRVPEFRAMVVELRSRRPVAEVARDLKLSQSTVFRWVRQDRIDPGELAGTPSAESASQPFLIEGIVQGEHRSHVPDLALIVRQGLITIVNVKPASRLGDAKAAATLAWAGVALPGWRQLLERRPAPAVTGGGSLVRPRRSRRHSCHERPHARPEPSRPRIRLSRNPSCPETARGPDIDSRPSGGDWRNKPRNTPPIRRPRSSPSSPHLAAHRTCSARHVQAAQLANFVRNLQRVQDETISEQWRELMSTG